MFNFLDLFSSSDPFTKALKSAGYLVIRLPKADVLPLLLLSKDGNDLEQLGPVSDVLIPEVVSDLPKVSSGTPTANISGMRTSDVKIGVGLSILGNIIGALGGTPLGLEVAYQQAKTATFEFLDVTEDKIEVTKLDQYLGRADINPANVFISKLLEADSVYVTTSVLKSSKFTFEAKQSNGAEVKVEVPVIQQVVGGNVSVSSSGASETKLNYEGKKPLAFGIKAVRLFFESGKFTAFEPAKNIAVKALGGALDDEDKRQTTQLLKTETASVRL